MTDDEARKLKAEDAKATAELRQRLQTMVGPVGPRYTVAEIAQIVDICRAAGIREFHYHELRFVFDGQKDGKAADALRNPALRHLLDGVAR